MGALSEPLNQMILNETHKTAKRINTHCDVDEGMKSGVPSSKTANSTNAYSSAKSPHLKASMNKTPVAVASKAIQTRKPGESADHSVHGSRSTMPPISLDYNTEVNLEQASMFYPVSTTENNARRSVGGADAPIATDEPEVLFSYAEPLTPTDVPYAHHTHSPHVASELWPDYHTDIEREAEEMAERDLAFAGKLFDSLSGSFGGSATSTFPTTSFVTRSNISIVSCDSDSDYSENDTTTPSIKEAEVEEAVEGTEASKPVGRIGTFQVTFYSYIICRRPMPFSNSIQSSLVRRNNKTGRNQKLSPSLLSLIPSIKIDARLIFHHLRRRICTTNQMTDMMTMMILATLYRQLVLRLLATLDIQWTNLTTILRLPQPMVIACAALCGFHQLDPTALFNKFRLLMSTDLWTVHSTLP